MVFHVVLRPAGESPRQLHPAVAAPRVRPDQRRLLALRPGFFFDVGPQLVVPALAALLAHAAGEQGGEGGPVALAVDGDEPFLFLFWFCFGFFSREEKFLIFRGGR